ncbi:GatB/YqeY domain-containing protein [Corynebacterium durum]|uniref:GatB/YqeY domain-containing protein n=1 Tax=Corynebacterium durum TaxID=61592 RepID=UPI0028E4E736|nr:GatB/YqeY domain-containing protein [Corynebacterium durum]
MSELQNKILADLKDSMKARNKERTATLRMLKAAVTYESVEGAKHELTDTDVLAVIRREVKKRRESAAIYAEAGRQELADAEIAEATILEEYLPQQLDDVAVAEVVNKHAAALEAELGEPLTMKHMKRIMSAVTEEVAGQADGKRLSEAVRLRIQQ